MDLLLLCSDALWVQVPVGVQVSSGDAQVFHSDGGAVRQVCIRGRTEHDLAPLQNMRVNEIKTLIMWIKLNSNDNKRHNIDYFWNTVTSPVRTEKIKQMSRPTWLPPTQEKRRHYLTDFIYALISFCLQSAATVQCGFFHVFGTHTRAWRRCADCSRSVGTGRPSWRIHLQVHCWEKTFRMLHQTFNQSWLTDSHTPTHLLFSTTKWTANIVM